MPQPVDDQNIIQLDAKSNNAITTPNPSMERLKARPGVQIGMSAQKVRQGAATQLRQWRKQAHLTQIELAERMNTTQKQVSRMESCAQTTHNITLDMMARFAHACGMQINIAGSPIEPTVVPLMDEAEA